MIRISKTKARIIVTAAGLLGTFLASASASLQVVHDEGRVGKDGALDSAIVRWSNKASQHPWGSMLKQFTGESHATKNLFVASFILKPGASVHAPHRHAQEEFMTISDGEGTWHLDGQAIVARKGDVIYVEPWILHGLTNTGKKPLTYFVVQFHGRGVAPAAEPPLAVAP